VRDGVDGDSKCEGEIQGSFTAFRMTAWNQQKQVQGRGISNGKWNSDSNGKGNRKGNRNDKGNDNRNDKGNRRSFDCASRDETARSSAQDDTSVWVRRAGNGEGNDVE
jgi:hypothetical protein